VESTAIAEGIAERIYRNLYDRFWRITNEDCQVNDYPVRGIAFLSLSDLADFGLEPDQVMEVQAAIEQLRKEGRVRRLTEEEETAFVKHLEAEGLNPKEFLESKDYLLHVGPK